MFRNTSQSLPNKAHFGVGSVIVTPDSTRYLVIHHNSLARLVNLHTFALVPVSVEVDDVNHLSEVEASELCAHIGLFDTLAFSTAGLKE